MKCQILFPGKNRKNISKCCLLIAQKTKFNISYNFSSLETICMKCVNLFPGKVRKIFQNVVC